ncbi:MAG: phosphatase PAP2 family protein [Actinomycetota bacterium]
MFAPGPRQSARRLRSLALVSSAVLVTVYLLGVRTAAGQALGDAAYLGRLAESKDLRVVDKHFLEAIDIRVFLLGGAALLLVAAVRRLWRAGFFVTGAYLAAILSAEILKAVLTRPILAPEMEVLMGAKQGLNTYPSGHSTFATALTLGVIFLVPAVARAWVAMGGIGFVVLVTGAVVTAGWHRPSDALAGIALATIWISLIAALIIRRTGVTTAVPAAMRLVPYVGTVIGVVGAIILVVMLAHPETTGALAMLAVKVLIFAWAVSAVTAFSYALRGVDLTRA